MILYVEYCLSIYVKIGQILTPFCFHALAQSRCNQTVFSHLLTLGSAT